MIPYEQILGDSGEEELTLKRKKPVAECKSQSYYVGLTSSFHSFLVHSGQRAANSAQPAQTLRPGPHCTG